MGAEVVAVSFVLMAAWCRVIQVPERQVLSDHIE